MFKKVSLIAKNCFKNVQYREGQLKSMLINK